MLNFLLCVPFLYFQRTRLNNLKSILFHAYAEWFLALVMLYFSGYPAGEAIGKFLLGYLAFISLYEIGYITNDVHSVRHEAKPRKRLQDFNPSDGVVGVWIGIRVIVFAAISYVLQAWNDPKWLTFYAVLALMFFLHNYLKDKQLKVFTFMNLAFLRFLAPFFIFLSPEQIAAWIPAIVLHYVIYRTLTYMDSKDLLNMPSRDSVPFKLNYYLLLAGISLVVYMITGNPHTLYVNAYFFGFWLFFFVLQRLGLLKQSANLSSD
jgi:hypothetical protein